MSVYVETNAGGGAGGLRAGKRVVVAGALAGAAAGAVLLPAGSAQAANVIGVGNPAFGNACANQGGAHSAGAAESSAGAAGGNSLALPLDLPRNQCGNSGFVCYALFMARD